MPDEPTAREGDSILETIASSVPAPYIPSGLGLRRGTKGGECKVLDVVPLVLEDLALMDEKGPEHSAAPVKRLKASHHAIARFKAAGMMDVEISGITGYSPTTISLLTQSPAFQNLLEHYQEKADVVALDLSKKINLVGDMALSKLQEYLDTEEELDPELVRKIAEGMTDRAGYSAVHRSKVDIRAVGLTGEDLRAFKQEANAEDGSIVVTANFKREVAEGAETEESGD